GIYSSSIGVSVDGVEEIVSESGGSETVNHLKVDVTDIGYAEDPVNSIAILRIGEDITKTYSDGDEYIGEDEDDPLWVWDISTACFDAGYIGITYNVNVNDADDEEAGDTVKYIGESYVFPENFADVKLVGITDVEYEDIKVEFDAVDLYNSTGGTAEIDDSVGFVVKLTGETTSTFTLGAEETNIIYIYYSNNGSAIEGGEAFASGAFEFFYNDHEGDATPTNKARYENTINMTSQLTLDREKFATFEVGD
ncbi:unnamed protein product, partial [marine sediment metagenome]